MILNRTRLKPWYFMALRASGAEGRRLRRLRHERGLVTVLNLHRVSPDSNPFWSPLHPDLFGELLEFLSRHFHVTTFAGLAQAPTDRPAAILSFDDGYHDFVEHAMPLLRRHRLAANQNIVPACVESGLPPWTVRISDFLRAAPRTLINELQLDGFSRRLASEEADEKLRYGLALNRFLKQQPRRQREPHWRALTAAMARLNGTSGHTRMMTLEEVRTAAAEHEIGAHSFSHESMGMESEAFFEEDLNRCEAFFAQRLGLPMEIYAFPNGSYRPEQIDLLRRRGIRHILLVNDRFARRGAGVYPRFTIYGSSRAEVRLQALGYRAGSLG